MKIRLFGILREITGLGDLDVSEPFSTVEQAESWLVEQYPGLEPHRSYWRCAVDQEYVNEKRSLTSSSELAFIPPVSGGAS